MSLVYDDQREGAADLLFPSPSEHQVELLRSGHEDPELLGSVGLFEHPGLGAIYFQRRANLLHNDSEVGEVSAQAYRELIYEGPRGSQVSNPAVLLVELVQRLEDSKLRDEGLAARSRQAHHDGSMT